MDKVSDFSLSQFLAWARTKNPDAKYYFQSTRSCALCQFLRETGRAIEPRVSYDDWRDIAWDSVPRAIPEGLRWNLYAGRFLVGGKKWTFGALVKRLEVLVGPESWTTADDYSVEKIGDLGVAPAKADAALSPFGLSPVARSQVIRPTAANAQGLGK